MIIRTYLTNIAASRLTKLTSQIIKSRIEYLIPSDNITQLARQLNSTKNNLYGLLALSIEAFSATIIIIVWPI